MPEPENLSPKQDRALELIAAGAPDTEIARMLGVTRQSIYRWWVLNWCSPCISLYKRLTSVLERAVSRCWAPKKRKA